MTERLRHRWAKCTVPHPKDAENKAAMYFCVQCGMVKQSVWLDKIRQYSRDDYRRGDFFQSAREPRPAPPCPHVFLPPTINGFTIRRNRTEENHARFGTISATIRLHAFTEDGYEKAT